MPSYVIFAVGTVVVLGFVILLAVLTEQRLEPVPGGARLMDGRVLGTGELYLNVLASQVLVIAVLIGLAWLTSLPPAALGVRWPVPSLAITLGVLLGIVLYILNELSVQAFDRFGIAYSEDLREALAPSSLAGWIVLLVVVLPIIATAEELLFRAAIIGAFEAGFALSPWLLAVASSVVFAVGHGVQGTGGIIVTGTLGFVLAAAFVISGSLLLVIVAHYVVNVLEFVINEGIRGRELLPVR